MKGRRVRRIDFISSFESTLSSTATRSPPNNPLPESAASRSARECASVMRIISAPEIFARAASSFSRTFSVSVPLKKYNIGLGSFDSLHCPPVWTDCYLRDNRYTRKELRLCDVFHHIAECASDFLCRFFFHFIDKFVVHLEKQVHFVTPSVFFDERVRLYHGALDDVTLCSLHRCINRHALCLRA